MDTDQKILVIGSNSFSGASFVDHVLDLGFDVMGISRSQEPDPVFLPYKWKQRRNSNFVFFRHDLNTGFEEIRNLILSFRPGYIVNFAAQGMVAQSWENPEQWFATNTMAHIRLHQFLKDCSFLKKYVHISTPEVYGSCEGYIKENTWYNPSTPYAVSKAATDMSLMTFFKTYGFPVIFIRSANVYGPGQLLYRIIPKASLFFLMGRPIELHGGGMSTRSFIHIKDVCRGTAKAMLEAKPGNIYHFASREALSVRALVEMMATLTNRPFSEYVQDVEDRAGKDSAYLLDCTKAKADLGWENTIHLEEGLMDTVEWIQRNMDTLIRQPFDYHHKP